MEDVTKSSEKIEMDRLVSLLRDGRIERFNEERQKFNVLTLKRIILIGVDLSKVDLSNIDLSDTDFSTANLSGANLSDANLSGANLSHANLSGVNLSRANLFDINLIGANLSGADFYQVRNCELSKDELDKRGVTNIHGW